MVTGQPIQRSAGYRLYMRRARPLTRTVVARNLRALMRLSGGLKSCDLDARSGVSQRQITNILNGSSAPTTETVEALAAAFGLQGWHLLLHDLPEDLVTSQALGHLVAGFIRSDADGRDLTMRMLNRTTPRRAS